MAVGSYQVAIPRRFPSARLECSLAVEGAAVVGESVEDLLGALVPVRGRGFRSDG
jgi:hypothetical protein